jgi:putative restriction endonuclease
VLHDLGKPIMSGESVLAQFDRLAGDQRAPHKPLLVLYALGRWARGDQGDVPFAEVNRDLTELLLQVSVAVVECAR